MVTIAPQEGFQERFTRSNCDVIFGGGVLNPQPLTSKILTPEGFRLISEIKAGDTVCGLQNEIQTITHCDLEGEKECIRIILEDGSRAECALDHKWWIEKNGEDTTAISFELLEAYQVCEEKGTYFDVKIFRYLEGKPVPVRIAKIEELGKLEVACIGVSNDDDLYITDDYLITKNCGKAQPLDAKILTPSGWTTMGELKVGDTICDANGGRQKVLRIYEKGLRHVYRVKVDGGETECCGEHLWRLKDRATGRYDTYQLVDIMHEYRRFRIPCPVSVDMNHAEKLPMKPYLFGKVLAVRMLQPFLVSKSIMARMELAGSKGAKTIPWIYKSAKVSDRKALLRGFLDIVTAGRTFFQNGVYTCVIRSYIHDDLRDIVSSLGGMFLVKKRFKKQMKVAIQMPLSDEYSSRTYKNVYEGDRVIPERRILDVSYSGIKPCRCILVSSPNHLYITDDYIVTHNTFAAILSVAEPSLDRKFRAAFTRRNLGNLKQGGGILDDFSAAYKDYIKLTSSGENPRITFPSGAYVDCLHIADETPSKLMERAKGWQYDFIYMDELTSYEFSTFRIVRTRNRGKADWSGHLAGTTNPKRSHWTRKMLSWYIGADGFIIPERDGVVRYFYMRGESIDDLIMGGSKEEVYMLCKIDIDRKLQRLAGKSWTYKDLISSFVFYAGKMSENKASIGHNSSYVGAVAGVGGKRAQQLIEGNFNVDEDEEDNVLISSADAQAVFMNDECSNDDTWITVDLADVGTDNVIALSWRGFHVDDIMIIMSSTPGENAERIKIFAQQHNVSYSHIIYDGTHGSYMIDYIPEAQAFISNASTRGLYKLTADRLKDECYLRLASVIKKRMMSISEKVAKSRYWHQNIKKEWYVQDEFLEECAVVRMREVAGGKKKLFTKKEMNAMLGRHRSMDLLDPCAMRMLPVLRYAYGEELEHNEDVFIANNDSNGYFDVYDESNWY